MLLVSRTLVFDRFRFKLPTRELLRVAEDGSETPIPLGMRAAEVLLFFLERPGELVTKSEIMQAVWPDAVVEESNLTVHVSAIRRAIDVGRNGESCIQNLPRRGYRFTLGVTRDDAAHEGQGHCGLPGAPQDARVRPASSVSVKALAAAPVLTSSASSADRLVQPETILRWHRAGFTAFWRWKSRKRAGWPKIDCGPRDLIRRMSKENPKASRIHGELLIFGFEVAQSTVSEIHSAGWVAGLEDVFPEPRAGDRGD